MEPFQYDFRELYQKPKYSISRSDVSRLSKNKQYWISVGSSEMRSASTLPTIPKLSKYSLVLLLDMALLGPNIIQCAQVPHFIFESNWLSPDMLLQIMSIEVGYHRFQSCSVSRHYFSKSRSRLGTLKSRKMNMSRPFLKFVS